MIHRSAIRALLSGWLLLLAGGAGVHAQLFFLGPIKFNSSLNTAFTYTTNADGVTDEQARTSGLEQEDYYITYGVSLSANTVVYPDIDLSLSASLNREKHFVRTDQDDDGDTPFLGNANFSLSRNVGYYNAGVILSHVVDTEYDKQDVFIPAGRRTEREISQRSTFSPTLGWQRQALSLNTRYSYVRERYNQPFEDGDENSQTLNLTARYQLLERVALRYVNDREKKELVNQAPGARNFDGWEVTETATVDFDVWQRPAFTFSVCMEKEDEGEEEGTWQPLHRLSISDTMSLSPTISLNYAVNYTFERDREEDDIDFTYSGRLQHDINGNYSHSLSAVRRPVDTFGSTETTDETTVTYNLTAGTFFIPRLSMNASYIWERNLPKGEGAGPEEITETYRISLNRPYTLGPSLSGAMLYFYDYEITERGDIPEHNLTLTLNYAF